MSKPVRKLSLEEEKYIILIEIYKKINEELARLRNELKKLQKNAAEKTEKQKVKDILHNIINTID